jgi:hypothetical protein
MLQLATAALELARLLVHSSQLSSIADRENFQIRVSILVFPWV